MWFKNKIIKCIKICILNTKTFQNNVITFTQIYYYNLYFCIFNIFVYFRVFQMRMSTYPELNIIAYQYLSFFALCAHFKQLDGELIRAGMSKLQQSRSTCCRS